MAQTSVHLTQSRFYSTEFNAAVFDGPVRIYFAQAQEDLALRVYHRLQSALEETYTTFRQGFARHGRTIFLLLYPNLDLFKTSFDQDSTADAAAFVVCERLGEDFVIAVRGPLEDAGYEDVFKIFKKILADLGVAAKSIPSA